MPTPTFWVEPVGLEEGPDGKSWPLGVEARYRRPNTGEEWARHELPPGAMFDAFWMPAAWRGTDGISLVVILPTGHGWYVDSEAANCTRPGEPHHCWVRHGDPRTEPVTVDKNGDTCAAGAGSIAVEGYHGFLRDGILTP